MVTLPWVMPLVVAFGAGAMCLALRLPPLVGFLVAGFALNATGVAPLAGLNVVADLGVALLLFSIGLKLDLRLLVRREVVATAWLHLALSIACLSAILATAGVLGAAVLADRDPLTVVLVAFALSFSSTVAVVSILDSRNQSRSFYGRVAIGILIWQDLLAVLFIVATADEPPSPWSILLLLLVPLRRPIFWALSRLPQGEMPLIFGLVVGLGLGYALFEACGLKGDLGALLMGVLLSGHPRSEELSKQVAPIKNLFLIGFFLSIGYTSELTATAVTAGLVLVALVPLQGIAYAYLLQRHRLRRRTSALIGLVLANNSEFGLIVGSVAVGAGLLGSEWLTILTVAVGGGMILGAVLNQWSEHILRVMERLVPSRSQTEFHPDDSPVEVGEAPILVLGLGRVGTSACHRLSQEGYAVLGVDSDPSRIRHLVRDGLAVVEADATDDEFWQRVVDASSVRAVVLAMPFHESNIGALARLTAAGFTGRVVAAVRLDRDIPRLANAGADEVLQVFEGAGDELAERVVRLLDGQGDQRPGLPR